MKKKTMAALVMMGLCAMGASALQSVQQSSTSTGTSPTTGHVTFSGSIIIYTPGPIPDSLTINSTTCGHITKQLQNQYAGCILDFCLENYGNKVDTDFNDPDVRLNHPSPGDKCDEQDGEGEANCCNDALTQLNSCLYGTNPAGGFCGT